MVSAEETPSGVDTIPNYLTLDEVAERLREDRKTTRRRLQRGDLPFVVLPGSSRILIAEADLVGYLARATRVGDPVG